MGCRHGGRLSCWRGAAVSAAWQPLVDANFLLTRGDGPHSAARYADADHPHVAPSSRLVGDLRLDNCQDRSASDAGQGSGHWWTDWTGPLSFELRDGQRPVATSSWKRTNGNLYPRGVRINRGRRIPRAASQTSSIRTARAQSDVSVMWVRARSPLRAAQLGFNLNRQLPFSFADGFLNRSSWSWDFAITQFCRQFIGITGTAKRYHSTHCVFRRNP